MAKKARCSPASLADEALAEQVHDSVVGSSDMSGRWADAPNFIERRDKDYYCNKCGKTNANDGKSKSGANNAIAHAATMHTNDCSKPWLAAYVTAMSRQILPPSPRST